MIRIPVRGLYMPQTRLIACALALMWIASQAATAAAPTRKEVLEVASKVADWQLARLNGNHIISHMSDESRDPRSWQQGAFWVGVSRLAHSPSAARFTHAFMAMGLANNWRPGPRV